MKHRIEIKEDKNGFYSVCLDGRVKAYGLTKDQAQFFYQGISHGIESENGTYEYTQSIYEIFSI